MGSPRNYTESYITQISPFQSFLDSHFELPALHLRNWIYSSAIKDVYDALGEFYVYAPDATHHLETASSCKNEHLLLLANHWSYPNCRLQVSHDLTRPS
jgi:hypothetical protein